MQALRSTIVAIMGFWARGMVNRRREDWLDMLAMRSLLGFVLHKLLGFVTIYQS